VLRTNYDRYMHWSLFEPVMTGYDRFFCSFYQFQFGYLAISFYGKPVTVTVFPKIAKKRTGPDFKALHMTYEPVVTGFHRFSSL
jgi:hypothetical protein